MNDSRIPQVTTYPSQVLMETALDGFPSCLVDDPVYLVDDSRILVGSLTVASSDIKLNSNSTTPNITNSNLTFKTNSSNNAPNVTIQPRH
jgi:hypothetical protein